jgi:xylan 1,4-beta-xylosidase
VAVEVGTILMTLRPMADISSYWVFSDVFEEGGILPGPFHGGFGLMTVHGTPKPWANLSFSADVH